MKRIPTLDGWRALAILLVLADHIQIASRGLPLYRWTWTGQHGVTIFFVLSGYLITTRLTEQKIDLGRFYVRRFFRLIPAAWAYLLTIAFLGLLSSHPLTSGREMLSCVLFYNNFSRSLESMCGHFWSLSLEEQFYIVWPCLLLFAGVKRARWVAGTGALACATYRWIYLDQYTNPLRAYESQVRVDALLIGCLLALLLRDQRIRQWTTRWVHLAVAPALGVLALCFARSGSIPPLSESLAIAVLICFTMLQPRTIAARFLELRPLVVVGIGSYSLYLWQQLFISTHSAILFAAGSATMAFLSYNLIEQPCIKLGSTILERKRVLAGASNESTNWPRSGVCPTQLFRSANSPAGSTSDS